MHTPPFVWVLLAALQVLHLLDEKKPENTQSFRLLLFFFYSHLRLWATIHSPVITATDSPIT